MAEQDIKVNCKQWKKNSDGSWVTTSNTDIGYTNGDARTIRLATGFVFQKGKKFYGMDIVEFLEENCKAS
jgi:hypothetical protein